MKVDYFAPIHLRLVVARAVLEISGLFFTGVSADLGWFFGRQSHRCRQSKLLAVNGMAKGLETLFFSYCFDGGRELTLHFDE